MPAPLSPNAVKQWKKRIAQFEASGQRLKTWCQEQEVSYHLFYYWRNKLCAKSVCLKREEFIELSPPSSPQTSTPSKIVVQCGDVFIHLQPEFDPPMLSRIIETIRGLPC